MSDGGLFTEVPLPDVLQNAVPIRMQLSDDKLYVLTRNIDGLAAIHRMNILSGTFEGEPILVGSDAFDFAVSPTAIAVSVFRPTAEKDVVILHPETGTWMGQITVSPDKSSWNAFGVALYDNSLTINTTRGVFRYALPGLSLIAQNTDLGQLYELAHGNGNVYVTIPAQKQIYELNEETLAIVRVFEKDTGEGRIEVIDTVSVVTAES